MEKYIIKEKKIECIIGMFLLIPPILGVLAFVLCLLGNNSDFATLRDLTANWTNDYGGDGGGGMSAAPIYLGLMALAGVWLIKDSLHFLFYKENEKYKSE